MSDTNNAKKPELPEATKKPTPTEENSAPSATPCGAEILPPEVLKSLEESGLSPDDPTVKRVAIAAVASLQATSGLIPPPGMLKEFEKIRPGTADQMFGWLDNQMKHRQKLEREWSSRSLVRMDRGQLITGSVAVAGIVGATLAAIFGDPYVAGGIVTISVGGPAAVITFLKRAQKNSNSQEPPTSN